MDGLKVIDADTLAIAWEKFQVHVKQTTNHKNASEYNNECTHIRVYCCFVVLLFSVHILTQQSLAAQNGYYQFHECACV